LVAKDRFLQLLELLKQTERVERVGHFDEFLVLLDGQGASEEQSLEWRLG
jgi:hypothetical protein